MKVLFISYYLPPLLYPQSIQIGRLLQAMKENGEIELTVVTANETGTKKDTLLFPDLLKQLDTVYIDSSYNRYTNFIKNRFLGLFYKTPDTHKFWMKKAFLEIKKIMLKKKFDKVITFSCPFSTNMLGEWIKKDFPEVAWVAHNSDPWSENVHLHHGPIIKSMNKKLERKSFQAADKIIFTSEETSQLYCDLYPEFKDRISTLNHSFDRSIYPDVKQIPTGNRPLIIRYIGTFYGSRTPLPLLEALNSLTDEERNQYRVEFIGSGPKTSLFISRFPKLASIVNVIGQVNYLQSLELMKTSDILVNIDASSEGPSVFFPSKLVDYIGADKLLLGIAPLGASNRILNELGHACFRNEDVDGIANWLRRTLIEGLNPQSKMDKSLVDEKYDMKKNGSRLTKLMSDTNAK